MRPSSLRLNSLVVSPFPRFARFPDQSCVLDAISMLMFNFLVFCLNQVMCTLMYDCMFRMLDELVFRRMRELLFQRPPLLRIIWRSQLC
jgi:hypothetical protein